jgi:hypothetical protein
MRAKHSETIVVIVGWDAANRRHCAVSARNFQTVMGSVVCWVPFSMGPANPLVKFVDIAVMSYQPWGSRCADGLMFTRTGDAQRNPGRDHQQQQRTHGVLAPEGPGWCANAPGRPPPLSSTRRRAAVRQARVEPPTTQQGSTRPVGYHLLPRVPTRVAPTLPLVQRVTPRRPAEGRPGFLRSCELGHPVGPINTRLRRNGECAIGECYRPRSGTVIAFTSHAQKYTANVSGSQEATTLADAAHNYSRGDRTALILFSAGTCYYPGCTEPLVKLVDGSYEIALEIAHIRAAKKGGQRFVKDMDDTGRAAFDNIIFLCIAHHKAVDKAGAEELYTITVLEEWKRQRERGAPEQLRGLRQVTEEKLEQMISSAVIQRDTDYNHTLARLEQNDQEAAGLLRELRAELDGLARSGRSIIDPDAVNTMDRAASRLLGLHDSATTLLRAADRLRGLHDNAIKLDAASSNLKNFEGLAGHLERAATRAADQLHDAASRIERAGRRFE